MKYSLLLLLLLAPLTVFAQATYDISCDNIANERIFYYKSTSGEITSNGGYFHLLVLDLKPDAAKEFGRLLRATSNKLMQHNGVDYPTKDMIITANGGPLQNDIPAITGLDEFGMVITIFSRKDVFAAARSVCPALVPDEVNTKGLKE